jgi:hypothetical protein
MTNGGCNIGVLIHRGWRIERQRTFEATLKAALSSRECTGYCCGREQLAIIFAQAFSSFRGGRRFGESLLLRKGRGLDGGALVGPRNRREIGRAASGGRRGGRSRCRII